MGLYKAARSRSRYASSIAKDANFILALSFATHILVFWPRRRVGKRFRSPATNAEGMESAPTSRAAALLFNAAAGVAAVSAAHHLHRGFAELYPAWKARLGAKPARAARTAWDYMTVGYALTGKAPPGSAPWGPVECYTVPTCAAQDCSVSGPCCCGWTCL